MEKRKIIGILVAIIVTVIMIFAAHNNENPDNGLIARSDLTFLEIGMSFDAVSLQIGEPDRSTGSGIYWFEYDLEDGSKLLLSFIHLDHLDQAVIVSNDGAQTRIFP